MIILGTNSIKDTGFNVANSLRFNSGSSDYLAKTFSSDGNRKKWTWSGWVKRSVLGTYQMLFMCKSGSTYSAINLVGDQLRYFDYSSSFNSQVRTNRVFRDVSAWYHIVVAYDTAQSTASNRVKIYVNNFQETSFTTANYPSLNFDGYINESDYTHYIGTEGAADNYFDGYMSEVCFIDGSALAPTDFGEFDEDSGIWKPISVSGLTFGTNGFYLDFEDSGALGDDVSGNGNDFTVNNLTAIDQSTDTCTNNFATLNPLKILGTATTSFEEGNLQFNSTNSNWANTFSTIAFSQGKWYAEFKVITLASSTGYGSAGIADVNDADDNSSASTINVNSESAGVIFDYRSGQSALKSATSSVTSNIGNFSANDIVGMAVDMDNRALYVHLNGTYYQISSVTGVPTSGASKTGAITIPTSVIDCAFTVGSYTDKSETAVNFGSPPYSESGGETDGNGYGNFAHAVPSGYLSLCTKNLSEVLG